MLAIIDELPKLCYLYDFQGKRFRMKLLISSMKSYFVVKRHKLLYTLDQRNLFVSWGKYYCPNLTKKLGSLL